METRSNSSSTKKISIDKIVQDFEKLFSDIDPVKNLMLARLYAIFAKSFKTQKKFAKIFYDRAIVYLNNVPLERRTYVFVSTKELLQELTPLLVNKADLKKRLEKELYDDSNSAADQAKTEKKAADAKTDTPSSSDLQQEILASLPDADRFTVDFWYQIGVMYMNEYNEVGFKKAIICFAKSLNVLEANKKVHEDEEDHLFWFANLTQLILSAKLQLESLQNETDAAQVNQQLALLTMDHLQDLTERFTKKFNLSARVMNMVLMTFSLIATQVFEKGSAVFKVLLGKIDEQVRLFHTRILTENESESAANLMIMRDKIATYTVKLANKTEPMFLQFLHGINGVLQIMSQNASTLAGMSSSKEVKETTKKESFPPNILDRDIAKELFCIVKLTQLIDQKKSDEASNFFIEHYSANSHVKEFLILGADVILLDLTQFMIQNSQADIAPRICLQLYYLEKFASSHQTAFARALVRIQDFVFEHLNNHGGFLSVYLNKIKNYFSDEFISKDEPLAQLQKRLIARVEELKKLRNPQSISAPAEVGEKKKDSQKPVVMSQQVGSEQKLEPAPAVKKKNKHKNRQAQTPEQRENRQFIKQNIIKSILDRVKETIQKNAEENLRKKREELAAERKAEEEKLKRAQEQQAAEKKAEEERLAKQREQKATEKKAQQEREKELREQRAAEKKQVTKDLPVKANKSEKEAAEKSAPKKAEKPSRAEQLAAEMAERERIRKEKAKKTKEKQKEKVERRKARTNAKIESTADDANKTNAETKAEQSPSSAEQSLSPSSRGLSAGSRVLEAKELADKQAKELSDKQARELADKQAKELADKQVKELSDKQAKVSAEKQTQEQKIPENASTQATVLKKLKLRAQADEFVPSSELQALAQPEITSMPQVPLMTPPVTMQPEMLQINAQNLQYPQMQNGMQPMYVSPPHLPSVVPNSSVMPPMQFMQMPGCMPYESPQLMQQPMLPTMPVSQPMLPLMSAFYQDQMPMMQFMPNSQPVYFQPPENPEVAELKQTVAQMAQNLSNLEHMLKFATFPPQPSNVQLTLRQSMQPKQHFQQGNRRR